MRETHAPPHRGTAPQPPSPDVVQLAVQAVRDHGPHCVLRVDGSQGVVGVGHEERTHADAALRCLGNGGVQLWANGR